MADSRLRIIGGQWRSRLLPFPELPGLRPTPNRVRETLFNWLQFDLDGARCLDLYAGSGALGFEALSRGAAQLTQVENQRAACQALRENAQRLGAVTQVIEADVLRFLTGPAHTYDVVFMDPPFGQGKVAPCCRALEDGGWLAPAARIYVECESALNLDDLPNRWRVLRSKQAGEVGYHLLQRLPTPNHEDARA